MSDHNITRVFGSEPDTEITAQLRGRLIAIVPEDETTGTVTVYHGLGEAVAASGTATAQDGGTEGDTITVGTITITLDDTPTGEDQIATEATAADLTTSLLAALLAHSDYADEDWEVEQTDTDELTFTAKVTGTPGNAIVLEETGGTWVVSGSGFLGGGTPGGVVFTICAAALPQAGKYFGDRGVRFTDGLAIVRSETADEIGVVWAAGNESI